jgi:hypothetical protein
LLDRRVCEPIDDVLRDCLAGSGGEQFTIPSDPSQGPDSQFAEMMAVWAWRISRQSFPAGSWPDALARVIILTVIGQGNRAAEDWRQLLAFDEYGPICPLVLAKAAALAQIPDLPDQIGSLGLRRLSVQDVRKEYPLFLDQRYPIGKCFRRMAAALRELDDSDIQTLSTLLPDGPAASFRQWAQRWRQDRKLSPDQALPELLDSLWQAGLREQVAAALKPLKADTATVNLAPADAGHGEKVKTEKNTKEAQRPQHETR